MKIFEVATVGKHVAADDPDSLLACRIDGNAFGFFVVTGNSAAEIQAYYAGPMGWGRAVAVEVSGCELCRLLLRNVQDRLRPKENLMWENYVTTEKTFARVKEILGISSKPKRILDLQQPPVSGN